jgi:hypothetical protein
VPDAGTLPPIIRFPSALGDAIVAAETLRHGLGNAATGGIWRVRGTEGSAILTMTPLPAASDPAIASLASGVPSAAHDAAGGHGPPLATATMSHHSGYNRNNVTSLRLRLRVRRKG